MKKFTNNLIKAVFIATAMFAGSVFADAASFDRNPSDKTGIGSIFRGDCSDCSGRNTSVSIDIDQPGDSEEVTVFVDFMTQRNASQAVSGAHVFYDTRNTTGSSSRYTFNVELNASNASSVRDTATVQGLPSSYRIEYLGGTIENVHGRTDPEQCSGYLYEFNLGSDAFSRPGRELGILDTAGNSWCAQGTAAATYRITNTERDQTIIVPPVVDNLVIDTRSATSVDENSATLRGQVDDGETQNVYFNYSTNSNVSCRQGDGRTVRPNDFDRLRNSTDSFSVNIDDLRANTRYYFRACGTDRISRDLVTGPREDFTTDAEESDPVEPSNPNPNTSSLDVQTQQERQVEITSAQLRGRVDTGSVRDVDVFFVWGEDESDIEDVARENRYDDIREDGRNIQISRILRENFDGTDNFQLNVNGLSANERVYYRLCAEFEDSRGEDDIRCGDIEDFSTRRASTTNPSNPSNPTNNQVQIITDSPRSVTQTTAELCADLVEDGGSAQQTFIEFRSSGQTSYTSSNVRQRNQGAFCERVAGLSPNTSYSFRACTPEGCGATRSFRTQGTNVVQGQNPIIATDDPTNIQANNARLNSTYIANADQATCFFEYGRNANLGKQTRTYNVNGFGSCSHNFTNLASNTQYCVRAVIQTVNGTDRGATKCFNTLVGTTRATSTGTPTRNVTPVAPAPVVVVEEDETEIDLASLGLGLSFVRLEIDNEVDTVVRGDVVTYEVSWENISELDLQDLGLKVTLPKEFEVTTISDGRLDPDENAVYFTINDLESLEAGDLRISGIIGRGLAGNLLTAEAELAYDNPVNDAQENAADYDLDEYGIVIAGQTASVFGGLGEVTFLGWLVIALGLFIIFLVARYLYLEREDMRAQAYAGGYRYGAPAAPARPIYRDPAGYQQAPPVQPPVAPQAPVDTYEPYRPNRG